MTGVRGAIFISNFLNVFFRYLYSDYPLAGQFQMFAISENFKGQSSLKFFVVKDF